ncbi:MAG: acyl--CoA ligase [Deltaproteobacteria bacterium]|nr:acyl--CoA ligase [Deltaproteobacteria bacterium]
MKNFSNIIELLNDSFERHGTRNAIADSMGVLTYASLKEAIHNVTQQLSSAGIGKGDRVGIDCDGRDLIIITHAVIYAGAGAVAIPRSLASKEKDSLIEKCYLTILISDTKDEHFDKMLGTINEDELCDKHLLLRREACLPPELSEEPEIKEAALIRFSSGTTGNSKGVLFTQRSLAERVTAVNEGLGIKDDDVILWMLPMAYHFIVSIMLYLSYGACIAIPKDHTPQSILAAIKNFSPSIFYATEHFYKLLLSNGKKDDLKGLRMAISTSAGLSKKTSTAFYEKFNIPIMQAYGIIEAGLLSINTDKPLEKADSVGKLIKSYEVKVLDKDNQPVAEGDFGSIFLRGPGFFDSYISEFRTRASVCDEGWFNTGDIGRVDEEGHLFLHGRTKDVINCMGMKMFAAEIEDVLNLHPSIKESLVKAKAHSYLNEVPYAMIVLNDGCPKPETVELMTFCGKHLAPHKIPRSVDVVKELPKTGSGKIKRS